MRAFKTEDSGSETLRMSGTSAAMCCKRERTRGSPGPLWIDSLSFVVFLQPSLAPPAYQKTESHFFLTLPH